MKIMSMLEKILNHNPIDYQIIKTKMKIVKCIMTTV